MPVLKHNDSFAVLDDSGNALERNEKEHHIADGIFWRDTRILSRALLTTRGALPAMVSSELSPDNVLLTVKLTAAGADIRRSIFLWQGRLYEELVVTNSTSGDLDFPLELTYGADFLDIFETRGWPREARGEHLDAPSSGISFQYRGHDKVVRKSAVSFSEAPAIKGKTASFHWRLAAGDSKTLYICAGLDDGAVPISPAVYAARQRDAEDFIRRQLSRRPVITSSNPAFDRWVERDAVDIALLTTEFETGPYPAAGIPWYSTPFGRDGIITAFELLWQNPALARGVLGYLAAHQADAVIPYRDASPGKIMHEIRLGEMADAGEVPHTPYYGTVDATPLFISLAGGYFTRTGDVAFLTQLWPHIERALDWIDKYGDRDGDGFVEYQRDAEKGLNNQGWKDSGDCISHINGELAAGSIALCEVQGYVYAAKIAAAAIAEALDKSGTAEKLRGQAETLKAKFNRDFWSDALGSYALALDGAKQPCLVSTSNPGHLLFSGIVPPDRAPLVAARLMSADMFSGWGIRTLSSREKRYEPSRHPEGYHNGTVWTHDTALCGAGFARYGMQDKASTLLTALFEAAQYFPLMRLPELFGGLPRETGKAPAPYPVACNPQAWASASGSLLLQAMLGIEVDGRSRTVTVRNPQLPPWLDKLSVAGLSVADGAISLEFVREAGATKVEVIAKSPGVIFTQG